MNDHFSVSIAGFSHCRTVYLLLDETVLRCFLGVLGLRTECQILSKFIRARIFSIRDFSLTRRLQLLCAPHPSGICRSRFIGFNANVRIKQLHSAFHCYFKIIDEEWIEHLREGADRSNTGPNAEEIGLPSCASNRTVLSHTTCTARLHSEILLSQRMRSFDRCTVPGAVMRYDRERSGGSIARGSSWPTCHRCVLVLFPLACFRHSERPRPLTCFVWCRCALVCCSALFVRLIVFEFACACFVCRLNE